MVPGNLGPSLNQPKHQKDGFFDIPIIDHVRVPWAEGGPQEEVLAKKTKHLALWTVLGEAGGNNQTPIQSSQKVRPRDRFGVTSLWPQSP